MRRRRPRDAPEKATSTLAVKTKTNSLGTLLATRSSQPTSSSSSNQNQPDPAEVRLARRVLELDAAWRANKVAPRRVCEALIQIVFGEKGTNLKPLATPVEIRQNNNVAVDSVFDRLAKRAKFTKQTDQILARLDTNDTASHLLAGLALLRSGQSEEALKRYAKASARGNQRAPQGSGDSNLAARAQ